MDKNEEIAVYIGQLVSAYLWYGRLCPALNECRMLLPKDSGLYTRIDAAYHTLMTGEGINTSASQKEAGDGADAAEFSSEASSGHQLIRRALAGIEEGEPYLILLHDIIVYGEETGKICEEALWRIAKGTEEREGASERKSISTGRGLCRNGKSRRRLAEKQSKSYARLMSLPDGRRRKKLRDSLVRELRDELSVFMLAMPAYTQAMGVTEALRRSQGLVHGFLRVQIRDFRKRLADGKEPMTICRGFLAGLELPEITACLLVCFGRDGEGALRTLPVGKLQKTFREKKRLRKGAGAAVAAGLIGSMVIQGIASQEGKKESRLRQALTQSLVTTVAEMPGIRETNQLLAGFMQRMLQQVDDDIDLTVKICDMDIRKQTLEVEASGEYDSLPGGRRRITVRRRLSF